MSLLLGARRHRPAPANRGRELQSRLFRRPVACWSSEEAFRARQSSSGSQRAPLAPANRLLGVGERLWPGPIAFWEPEKASGAGESRSGRRRGPLARGEAVGRTAAQATISRQGKTRACEPGPAWSSGRQPRRPSGGRREPRLSIPGMRRSKCRSTGSGTDRSPEAVLRPGTFVPKTRTWNPSPPSSSAGAGPV